MLRHLFTVVILAAGCVPGVAQVRSPFCKVNGIPVYGEGSGFLARELKLEGRPVSISSLGSELVTDEVLRQAAVAKGLDKNSEVVRAAAKRVEDTLAAVCRGRLEENAPAASREELESAWNWAQEHALIQYELYRINAKTRDEALQKKKELTERMASRSLAFRFEKPIWAIPGDEELSPREYPRLKRMIESGKHTVSEPYAMADGFAVLEFTGKQRKVDPLLRIPLSDYVLQGEGSRDSHSFSKEFMPSLHVRKVLERLRAAAKEAPMPADGAPWPPAEREAQGAVDQRLLAGEARRLRLDKEDWVAQGLPAVRAHALARAYFEEQLAAKPITEAALRAAFERSQGAPVEFRVQSLRFETEAQAKAALPRLKADANAAPANAEAFLAWCKLEDLIPAVTSALRSLDRGAWCEKPVAADKQGFYLVCWQEVRQAPGFDQALEAQRDVLLKELRDRRWYELVDKARKAAKIESVGKPR